MALWTPEQLDAVGTSLRSARAGTPTLLVIEGQSGTGKTTLLDELTAEADDFAVLTAEGPQSGSVPFGVLQQWGVHVPTSLDGALPSAFGAAQYLRQLIDGRAATSPVLLRLDDGQWADRESIETLVWLLRRAAGDRLLVAVGTRPPDSPQQQEWRAWGASIGGTVRLTLAGLSRPDALTLIRQRRPQITPPIARRLWEHTGGNPLYLTALLDEYDPGALGRMQSLPAPAAFAQQIQGRLERLPVACTAMARAVAVLGTGWVSLFIAVEVGKVGDPTDPVQLLSDAGILQTRLIDGQATIRMAHALVRAAIYQAMTLPQRRAAHLIAADIVSDLDSNLEHRMAAAVQYDPALADELENYADVLYARQSHRLAGLYRGWASTLTPGRAERERRWLDSLFDKVLARDLAAVRVEVPDVLNAADRARAAAVLGALGIADSRWDEAAAVMVPIIGTPPAGGEDVDRLTRYRLEILFAYAGVGIGLDNSVLQAALQRAAALGVHDAAMSFYHVVTAGQLQARQHGPAVELRQLPPMPDRPPRVPPEHSNLLSWRAAMRFHVGYFREAIADLREVQLRIQNGLLDISDGGVQAFLGQTYWMNGDWGMAQMCFRLAQDVGGDLLLPYASTWLPLAPAGSGDFVAADQQIDRAMATMQAMPWLEAVQSLLIARVVRLHAGGDPREQRLLLADMRRRWPNTPFEHGWGGPTWLLHLALATIWAGEAEQADPLVTQLETYDPLAPWVPAVAAWLHGLIAETRHQDRDALAHFRVAAAAAAECEQLPFYRAHMLADHARLGTRLHLDAEAAPSLRQATDIYRALGAAPYLQRIQSTVPPAGQPAPAPGSRAPHIKLTEREQDVMTLTVSGMSYAQISRELFITQSTVSYHLGNLYAKAGVRSRHELAALGRADPAQFGLSPLASSAAG